MPTLDELLARPNSQPAADVPATSPSPSPSPLDQLLQGGAPPIAIASPNPVATPVAPPAVAPLDSLLQQQKALDPSLDELQDRPLDERPQRVKRLQNAWAVAKLGEQPRYEEEDTTPGFFSGLASGAVKTATSIIRAPETAATAVGSLLNASPEGQEFMNSWLEANASPEAIAQGKARRAAGTGIKKAKELQDNLVLTKVADWIDEGLAPELGSEPSIPATVGSAFGSAGAFLAGGALGQAAKIPAWLTTAAMGGAAQASDQYKDAIAKGASPDEALIAYVAGAGLGTTEAVEGAWFLNRLNKLTGGKILEKLKNAGLHNTTTGITKEALKGFAVESMQEGLQTVGSNAIAADIAGYDPTRNLGENFWSSVLTGGLVGSTFGAGIGALNKSAIREAQAELAAEQGAKRASGDPINMLDGAMTPVDDLMAMRLAKDELDQHIANIGEQWASDVPAKEQLDSLFDQRVDPKETGVPKTDQSFSYVGSPAKSFDAIGELIIDDKLEAAVPKLSGGRPSTVRWALQHTPVVATAADTYAASIHVIEENIKKIKSVQEGTASKEDLELKLNPKMLPHMEKTLAELKEKQGYVRDVLKWAKDYAASFRAAMGEDTKLVLTDYPFKGIAHSHGGAMQLSTGVDLGDGIQRKIATVYLKLDELATEMYNNKRIGASFEWEGDLRPSKNPTPNEYAKARIFETMNHELGHYIATNFVAETYDKIKNGKRAKDRTTAYKAFAFMLDTYDSWIKQAVNNPQRFMLDTQYAMLRAQSMTDAARKQAERGAGPDINTASMKAAFPANWPKKGYLLSFDEFFAEMTARLATQGRFADAAMNEYFKPLLKKYEDAFKTPANFTYRTSEHAGAWRQYLDSRMLGSKISGKIEELSESTAGRYGYDLVDALRGKLPGYDRNNFASPDWWRDQFSGIMKYGFNVLQLQKENPHIKPLQTYVDANFNLQSFVRNFQADATEAIVAWRNLGKVEASALADVLYEEGLEKKYLTLQELSSRLTAEALEVYTQVRQQLKRVLAEMRLAAEQDAKRTIYDNTEMLNARLKEIKDEFSKLENQGYFPFLRFGKYTITATANEDFTFNGEEYSKGQLITFPVFETQRERDDAIRELKQQLKGQASVSPSVMSEGDMHLQGMPRSLLQSLYNKLKAAGDLSPEMEQAFQKALKDAAPFRNFMKQFQRKKNIHGYSMDAMRSFAQYISAGANHLGRVNFADQFRDSIAWAQQEVEHIKLSGGYAQSRQEIVHYMREHMDYVMNPTNELAALRGAGFFAFLGFNVKSALVNGTQIVTTAAPYLSARYGDAKAVAALTKATWTLKDWVTNKKKYIKALDYSTQESWKKNLTAAARVGATESAAHFATQGGAADMLEGIEQHKDVKFYDLSNLNIAPPKPEVWKRILEKTLEIHRDEGSAFNTLTPGRGQLFGVKDIDPDADAIIEEYLEEERFEEINNDEAQEMGLYRGALALGYDGFSLIETAGDEYFDNPSTVNVFNNLDKLKEISRGEYNKNKQMLQGDASMEKRARIARMIAQGIHEGHIDQSLATELAIARTENNLDRGLPIAPAKRFWHEVSRYSALPFHLVEKMNRYITAIAAYELEYDATGDHAKATTAARLANWSVNYENSRWARPRFMRGKKSVFLLFMNYLQNTLYFATHDKGAMRWYLTMLLLAGYMGLPGAEDLEDLVDFVGTGLNKLLGIPNPKVTLRVEARRALEELALNPDLIRHGLSQDSFGWGQIGELTGLPIPHFDLSRSLGLGNIIPGTEMLSRLQGGDPNAALVEGLAGAAGAGGNLVQDFYTGLFSNDPDTWKRVEKMMPMVSVRSASKALRIHARGAESTRAGEIVAEFDPNDLRMNLELLGQGLGFQPTRLSQGWERQIAVQDEIRFYKVSEQALRAQLNWAFFQEDREAEADVKDEIRAYNDNVPYPEMMITPDSIKESLRSYLKSRMKAGMGLAAEKKYDRLKQRVEESYRDPWSNQEKRTGAAFPQ